MMKNSSGLSHHYSTNSLVNEVWDFAGSNIRSLFKVCNEFFFWNSLLAVEVFWDSRMYFARSYCHFNAKEGKCWIALSEPLLKTHPRKNLVESLLHEMVHAYLYMHQQDHTGIINPWERGDDLRRTNRVQTVEVESNRMEVQSNYQWVCNGVCRNSDPDYGVVTKAVDLSPGPQDAWWWEHAIICGGVFTKVPSSKCRRRLLQEEKEEASYCPVCCNRILEGSNHIQRCLSQNVNYVDFHFEKCAICGDTVSAFKTHLKNKISNFVELLTEIPDATTTSVRTELNTPFSESSSNNNKVDKKFVHCPVCLELVNSVIIQEHVDICVNKNSNVFNDSL